MTDRVRAHTRKTPSGGRTRVRNHSRASRPRKAIISPGHSWKLMKKAFRAGRKKRRTAAVVLGLLSVIEFTAWLTLEGASLILATAGVLALSVAVVGASAGGVGRPRRGRRDPKPAPAAGKPAGAPKAPPPDEPKPARPAAGPDHAATLGKLGAIWSDDFGDYASGKKGAGEVHCALCQCAPCRCPEFGTPAYFKLLDVRHGRGKKRGE